MARKPTLSVEERLARFAAARDVNRALSSGIDRLPVSDLARTVLKVKSGQLVAAAAETGAALVQGAAEAARGGVETYHRSKEDLARPGPAATSPQFATPPPATTAGPATPPTATPGASGASGAHSASGEDLTLRLERLSALHAAGHLDDREYAAAKAQVLGLDVADPSGR